eukprot:748355_1
MLSMCKCLLSCKCLHTIQIRAPHLQFFTVYKCDSIRAIFCATRERIDAQSAESVADTVSRQDLGDLFTLATGQYDMGNEDELDFEIRDTCPSDQNRALSLDQKSDDGSDESDILEAIDGYLVG